MQKIAMILSNPIKVCSTHTHKADKYNVPGISCYGINGHKKGEVDHVYILNKAATQQEVGAGHAQKKCCLC